MKIHVPYISDQNIGGGYTFFRNFLKAAEKVPEIQMVPEAEEHDILFAFGPTTVNGETIERSKSKGARFVLRMDGVPEDTRNSGRGTKRMVEYALKADYIVYQSEFVYETLGKILKNNGVSCPAAIVKNGVDTEIFRPDGEKINFRGEPNILHIAYRKDNNKRYEEVIAMYREYFMNNKKANLVLLGRYPTEWATYNMGFFNGERFQKMGVQTDDKMKAYVIRSCDFLFYPSFADPAPNAVMEALACGVPVLYQPYGGVSEMVSPRDMNPGGVWINYISNFTQNIEDLLEKREELSKAARQIAEANSLENMLDKYMQVFDRVLGQA